MSDQTVYNWTACWCGGIVRTNLALEPCASITSSSLFRTATSECIWFWESAIGFYWRLLLHLIYIFSHTSVFVSIHNSSLNAYTVPPFKFYCRSHMASGEPPWFLHRKVLTTCLHASVVWIRRILYTLLFCFIWRYIKLLFSQGSILKVNNRESQVFLSFWLEMMSWWSKSRVFFF